MSSKGRADEFWPLLVEFAFSLKGRWLSICNDEDLSLAQGHALRTLDPDRPMGMGTLADALLCDASNVTGIVDKLESRGLIARQGADHDRRIKMLVVTERGRQVRQRIHERLAEP